MKRATILFVLFFVILAASYAQTVKVNQKSDGGWELIVDNKQFFVKGVMWSVNPPGTSHNYSLWNESDATIRRVIDVEGELMKAAGINAIRVSGDIPRKWVEYMYNKHEIYSILTYDLGRWYGTYGHTQNYYEPEVRENIMKTAYDIVNRHKDTSGVLLYMFGDGNGHGLYWTANDNAPEVIKEYGVDPRFRKARALFSLTEAVFQQTKELDPYRPVGFLTNDLGWIELIVDECPSMDFLGSNFGGDWASMNISPDFWRDLKQKLNKPIIFGSIGADAWNAKLGSEDQYTQAVWIAGQWKDIYSNAYGNGQSNALGGVINEWTDGWYKTSYDSTTAPQVQVHDTQPVGTNQGYAHDYTPGLPNLNPEWMGITSQGQRNYHSWFTWKLPRASFYALQYIWSVDPWKLSSQSAIEAHFNGLDFSLALTRGLQDSKEWIPGWKITNTVSVTGMQTGDDVQATIQKEGENLFTAFNENHFGVGLKSTFWGATQQQAAVGNYLEGEVTVLFRHDETAGGGPLSSNIFRTMEMGLENRPVELYQAHFLWKGFGAEVSGYYHYGKGGWTGEGDFFNLNTENYDLYSNDIWDIKSPIAVEARYNFGLGGRQGLAVVTGPKIYSGASPMILTKWFQEIDSVRDHVFAYSVMAGQEFSSLDTQLGEWGENGEYTNPATKASLWFSWKPWLGFGPFFEIQAGIMGNNFHKVGERYFKRSPAFTAASNFFNSTPPPPPGEENYYPFDTNGNPVKDPSETINSLDALAAKLRVEYQTGKILGFMAEVVYAGLVADSNWVPALDSTIFADIGTGNRFEVKGGVGATFGNTALNLNALYRTPLQGPVNSEYVGGDAIAKEPFIVHGNREVLSLELMLAFDLEPANWIWEWNVWDTEAAKFATRLRGRYTIFEGASDPGRRKGADGKYRYDYTGYPESSGNFDLGWMVFCNPSNDLRIGNSLNFTRGFAYNGIPNGTDECTCGDPETKCRVHVFGWSEEVRVRYKRVVFKGGLAFDLWGPVSSDRENNQTYPLLWTFDLAWSFVPKASLMDSSNRVGVCWNGVIRDRYSPNTNLGRDSQELLIYFNYTF